MRSERLIVSLPPDLRQRMQDLVSVGDFDSEAQLIRTAIRYYFREMQAVKAT